MSEAIHWQKSSFSGADDTQDCVELAGVDGMIRLRESDHPDQVITMPVERLRSFLRGVKAGEFDHLTGGPAG
ncbi:DUF397 domain-containing protein [Streptomyces sp. CAU 1734]|uniref:DUF397 domain-containing protein n=1 Tax=Streptomyces sp. CAU 1734 TaxID=3140360 RepID=UPI0032610048